MVHTHKGNIPNDAARGSRLHGAFMVQRMFLKQYTIHATEKTIAVRRKLAGPSRARTDMEIHTLLVFVSDTTMKSARRVCSWCFDPVLFALPKRTTALDNGKFHGHFAYIRKALGSIDVFTVPVLMAVT